MNKYGIFGLAMAACLGMAAAAWSGEDAARPDDIVLPAPSEQLGLDVMDALRQRRSTREYAPGGTVDLQKLSNLLWAGFGLNRPGNPDKRTAPFARGINLVKIYALSAAGAFLYDPVEHKLTGAAGKDLREVVGMQDFVKSAPLVLLFTWDRKLAADRGMPNGTGLSFAWNGLGAIQQNIALAAAAQELGGVVVASVKKPEAAAELGYDPANEEALTIMPIGPLK